MYSTIRPDTVANPGNEKTNSNDDLYDENLSHAIICIFNHKSSCNSADRQETEDTHSILLLLGGTLDAWLSDDRFLGSTSLSRIILAGNFSTGLVFSILKVVKEVTVMHVFSHDDFLYLQADVIWPFVYPLTIGKKVHTKHFNRHIESLRGMGCELWDERYMENSLKRGLARLFGLGVATSRFRFLPPRSGTTVKSKYISLNVEFIDFEVGKDGKFCIVHVFKDIICIIRPIKAIILRLSQENRSVKNLKSHIELTFECRGNMFDDKIYTKSLQFQLDIPEEEYSLESVGNAYEDSSDAFLVDIPV